MHLTRRRRRRSRLQATPGVDVSPFWLLAVVAALLVGTAGGLTASATRRGGRIRPTRRVPLPVGLTRLLDSDRMRTLTAAGLAVACVLGLLVSPPALMLGLSLASACLGPFWGAVNPLRLLHRLDHSAPGRATRCAAAPARRSARPGMLLTAHAARLGGLLAGGWVLLAAWLALNGQGAGAGAVLLLTGYAALQLALTWHQPELLGVTDAVESCNRVVGSLAPFGRAPHGRFALRSPAAGIARVPDESRSEVALLPVSAALIAAMALGPLRATPGAAPTGLALRLLATALVCWLVLRAGAHRAFLARALLPVPAGWALAGAVRAGGPVEAGALLAVALLTAAHLVALSAAHRMALDRFDLRSARAVQFPFRLVVLSSALAGVTLLAW